MLMTEDRDEKSSAKKLFEYIRDALFRRGYTGRRCSHHSSSLFFVHTTTRKQKQFNHVRSTAAIPWDTAAAALLVGLHPVHGVMHSKAGQSAWDFPFVTCGDARQDIRSRLVFEPLVERGKQVVHGPGQRIVIQQQTETSLSSRNHAACKAAPVRLLRNRSTK
jgi:hypothetical protein